MQCCDCYQTIEDSDDIFAVYEESFAEYCGLAEPEDAPKSLRGSTKKKVREQWPSTSLRVNEWRVARKRESRSLTAICDNVCAA